MFASLSLGLALLPFVVATVHDVQVGGANGLLEYSPEALVSFHFALVGQKPIIVHTVCCPVSLLLGSSRLVLIVPGATLWSFTSTPR